MKIRILLLIALISIITLSIVFTIKAQTEQKNSISGFKGEYEITEAQILKVFSADDSGARFRAYLVKWKDFEVIVSDVLGTSDKKEGDLISFIAQRIENQGVDRKISKLQFIIVDLPYPVK
jgi:hypothetical protein